MAQFVEYVTDYMSVKLITLSPDLDIQVATKILLDNKISGAPVIDSSGNLIGMLSEKDCIRLVIDGMYNQIPSGTGIVSEYMSRNIKTLDCKTTIVEASQQFLSTPYRRFPILEKGKLIGQISRRDVLKAIVKRSPKIDVVPSTWKGRVPV
jgi:predicted transcriptional regulator